jgi:hypothetical protein
MISLIEILKKHKMKYETVLNWLGIDYNDKKELWRQLEQDAVKGNLNMFEYRYKKLSAKILENFYRT